MRYAAITGWGKCVPPAVLTNADLETVVDTSDEWITTRTGIKERRISHVQASDLGAVAARHALAAAGRSASEVDLVLLATTSPDTVIPQASSLLQDKIGATAAGALDVNSGCAGWIYGLSLATQLVRTGAMERVLVVGAEKLHFWVDYTDRNTCVLFGDGAGAVLLEPSEEPAGVLSFELGSDGSAADILCVEASGSAADLERAFEERSFGVRMDGPEVFRRAVTVMGESAVRVVEEAGLELGDIDLLIPHQANMRIIDATARRLKLDPSQVYINIASYGNTSTATIPIALTEALEEGKVSPGGNLVFASFGAGLSWAAAVVRWGDRLTPVVESDVRLPPTERTALELLEPNFRFFGRASPPG
ncbi:MAG: ketoacyl-ACP synthase III [Actinomycetota bacterium]|nr:ketoacyl-ACP synthase III [Actinomycetota bacterium]